MSRQRKTPAERAQEAFDVAQRLVDKLSKKHKRLYEEVEQVRFDLKQAVNRRDYARQDPELPNETREDSIVDKYDEDTERPDDPLERNADAQQSGGLEANASQGLPRVRPPWEDEDQSVGEYRQDIDDR